MNVDKYSVDLLMPNAQEPAQSNLEKHVVVAAADKTGRPPDRRASRNQMLDLTMGTPHSDLQECADINDDDQQKCADINDDGLWGNWGGTSIKW